MSVQIAPDSTGIVGNTQSTIPKDKKQPAARVGHFFTWNNYTKGDIELLLETLGKIEPVKYVFQEETGENGTNHLQGVIILKHKMRDTEFKLPSKIHWEKLKKEDAAVAYCQKAATRTGQTWKFGFPKPIQTIEILRPWQQTIYNMTLTEPNDRTINWFWEPTGNVGKSAFVKYMVVRHRALFCFGGKTTDIINLIFNTNMDECTTIIFDIPRVHEGKVAYTVMEQIKNGLICNTKYETGQKAFNPPHVICMANFEPDLEKLSIDRWNVVKL